MDDIGAQELSFPALLPREPYEATNRWTEYGPNIFRLQDRKGADYLLGPTHEEMFTLVVKDLYSSYKDLPLSIYQIQTKYRDEARPRAGLLRGREFIMKDSYSFDVDDVGLDESYARHREAYIRIFDKLGFEYVIVRAHAGAMGGSKSEEFLAKAAVGEDTYVTCPECGFAANVEAVETPSPDTVAYDDAPAAHVEDTPDTPTIDSLVGLLNDRFPREDRPWLAGGHARRTCSSSSPSSTAPASRSRSACPATARSTPSVSRRRSTPPRSTGPSARTTSRSTPTSVQGLHRPGALGEGRVWRYPLPRRPAHRGGHPRRADRRGPVPGRRRASTWWWVATSRPTARSRPPSVRAGDGPAPSAPRAVLEAARGIADGPHRPARPEVRRKRAGAHRGSNENGASSSPSRWAFLDGIGPLARRRGDRGGHAGRDPGLCWPRAVAPGRRARRRGGQGREAVLRGGRDAGAADLAGAGHRGPATTTARGKVSPGREVQGRRAARSACRRSSRSGRGLAGGTVEVRDRRTDAARGGRGRRRGRPRR